MGNWEFVVGSCGPWVADCGDCDSRGGKKGGGEADACDALQDSLERVRVDRVSLGCEA